MAAPHPDQVIGWTAIIGSFLSAYIEPLLSWFMLVGGAILVGDRLYRKARDDWGWFGKKPPEGDD